MSPILIACDALVVLGAAVRADGTASPALRRRALHAARLLARAGGLPVPVILCGAAARGRPSEAAMMRAILVEQGVPAARILLDQASRDTFENGRNAARIARERGLGRLGVVTDAYHMRRGLMVLRAFGADAIACPVPDAEAASEPWRTRWARAREIAARAWYRVRIAQVQASA